MADPRMPDPGYDPTDNIFTRIGRQIFGSERDVKRVEVVPQGPQPPAPTEADQRAAAADARAINPSGRNWGGRATEDRSQWVGAGEGPAEPTRPVAHDESRGTPLQTPPARYDDIDYQPHPSGQPPAVVAQGDQPTGGPQVAANVPATVTPPGKPAPGKPAPTGGVVNTSATPWKQLGDQTRTAAYDPTKDRMDPRNMGPLREGREAQGETAAWAMDRPGRQPTEPMGGKTMTTGAMQGAVAYVQDQFHQGKQDGNTADGYAALTTGAIGSPDDDTIRAVFATVDPKGELPMDKRLELATKVAFDWYNSRGETDKANKVAAEMLQYGNKNAQAYGKQAVLDMKNGDRNAAIQNLTTAYGWLPDGYQATVKGNGLEIHNGEGKVIQTIPLDDKMITNLGMGLASGTLYWDVVQQRAGTQTPFGPPKMQPSQAVATAPPGAAAGAPAPQTASAPAAPASPPAAPPPAATPPAATPPPAAAAPTPSAVPPSASTPPVVPPATPPPPAATAPPSAPAPAPTPPVPPAAGAPATSASKPTEPAPTQAPATAPAKPAVSTETPPTLKPKKNVLQEGEHQQPDLNPDGPPPGTEPYRKTPSTMRSEVAKARAEIAAADKEYNRKKTWLATESAKIDKKDQKAVRAMAKLKEQMDADHAAATKRATDVLSQAKAERAENDRVERAELKPKYVTGQEKADEVTMIDNYFATQVKNKAPAATAGPLAKYNKPETWAPVRDITTQVLAHNRDLSPDQVIGAVVAAVTPVGTDQAASTQSANGRIGEKGSRFKRLPDDLLGRPVIQVGSGSSQVTLHLPKGSFNEILRLKQEAFEASKKAAEEAEKEKNRKGANWGALMPGQLQNTIDSIKGSNKELREKTEKATGKSTTEMKGDQPPAGLSNAELQEWYRKQRRKAPTAIATE